MSFNFNSIKDIPVHRQNGTSTSNGSSGSSGASTSSGSGGSHGSNGSHIPNGGEPSFRLNWRLRNKRGSSLDTELSVSRSIEEEGEDGTGGEALQYNHRYGPEPIDCRAQSSLSENGIVGGRSGSSSAQVVAMVATQSATLPAGVGNSVVVANGTVSAPVSNLGSSTDELNNFQANENGSPAEGAVGTGGRSTRATTPADEQIFQEPIESLQVRIGRLLSCEEMSDMHFLVSSVNLAFHPFTSTTPVPGQTPPPLRKLRIPAHRLIIASASHVFKELLFDPNTNQLLDCHDDIEINDIEPAAFLEFLRYAYTDCARINKDNAVGVLVAARRFGITNLEQQAVDYIHKCLNKKTCLAIWLSARAYGDSDLERAAIKSVEHFAEPVLLSNDFIKIDLRAMCDLLADDFLRADEIVIFRALTRWAKQGILRAGLCPTRLHVRSQIGEAMSLVRFPLMSEEQLQRMVAAEGILDDELLKALVHCSRNWSRVSHLISSAGSPMTFPNHPRTWQKLATGRVHQVFRFGSFENTLPNHYFHKSLNFLTNKRIWLSGVGLYAPRKACAFYLNVYVRVRRSEPESQVWSCPKERCEKTALLKYDGTGHIMSLYFDEPMQIEPSVQYQVTAGITPSERSTSVVRARLHPHLYYTRPGDINFYYGTEGQYATKVRLNNSGDNVIFNFNWDASSIQDESQSDSASNNNYFYPTAASEPATPNPPPRPPPPQEYRRPSRMQRLRRALSFIDRREDANLIAREAGLLEGQIPVMFFYA